MPRHAPDTTTGSAATTDWRHNGACASHPNPNLWHPTGKPGARSLQAEEAKTICRQCPVIDAVRRVGAGHPPKPRHLRRPRRKRTPRHLRRRQRAAAKEAA